jgi:hypothetical protein
VVSFLRVSSPKPYTHSSSSICALHALPIPLSLFGHTNNILESLKLVILLVMTDRTCLNANERKAGLSRADTAELHLSVLIGNLLDMYKILIMRFILENILHWQHEVRLLLFTVCTVPASKPFDHAWFGVLEATTPYCTWSDNR